MEFRHLQTLSQEEIPQRKREMNFKKLLKEVRQSMVANTKYSDKEISRFIEKAKDDCRDFAIGFKGDNELIVRRKSHPRNPGKGGEI